MKHLITVLKQLILERKKKRIKEQIIKAKYKIWYLKIKLSDYEERI